MDKTKYTTEHRKSQHLTSEERHIIEVRLNKDHQTPYQIAKELHRPYNTIKNEIARVTVLLYTASSADTRRMPGSSAASSMIVSGSRLLFTRA